METLQWLQLRLPAPAFDALKFSNGLILLFVLLVPLERLFAQRPQRVLRPGFATDLGWYFVSSLLPGRLLWLPLLALAWAAPHLTPTAWQVAVGALPGWARLVAGLVVAELGAYWGHRWMHAVPLLWRFHALHHSAEQMDWLVNTRAHPLDMAFQRFCGLAPTYVLGLSQPTAGSVDWAPLLLVVIGTGWGFFVHANLNWRLGWLERVISSPGFHHWHHSGGGPAEIDKNFAAMLPAIDLVFGTFYLPKHRWPAAYGTQNPVSSHLIGQLIDPLLPARKPQGNGMASLGKR